ncbi:SUKH-4 family immunity protein [Streptomyces hoynatensis]|uniref:SUKH-4 family immunity protein n=1 Tax=Streptomyces hoynatensis TaxID=1141874 RepID=A0A3A9YQF0_9ACTN|nr:SUKH-4 family immunity protein [Streptomyces hoynatensis]RKN37734.1 hypothetical protein D7294_26625 [Streptomyces hoynatensis]
MVTFAQAQERAERWVNGSPAAEPRREVRVREFDLGFVAWAEGPGGAQAPGGKLVIARDSGDTTLWPALPVAEVIRRYEEEYGALSQARPAPKPPERIDLNQTSFLLTPPDWLQEAADRAAVPGQRTGAEPEAEPAGVRPGAARREPAPTPPPAGKPWTPAAPAAPPAPPPGAAPAAPSPWDEVDATPSRASRPAAGASPWAGTDTSDSGDEDAASVAPPATVFSPPVVEVHEEAAPAAAPSGPTLSSEARTAVLPQGSALPPTAVAPPPPEEGAAPPGKREKLGRRAKRDKHEKHEKQDGHQQQDGPQAPADQGLGALPPPSGPPTALAGGPAGIPLGPPPAPGGRPAADLASADTAKSGPPAPPTPPQGPPGMPVPPPPGAPGHGAPVPPPPPAPGAPAGAPADAPAPAGGANYAPTQAVSPEMVQSLRAASQGQDPHAADSFAKRPTVDSGVPAPPPPPGAASPPPPGVAAPPAPTPGAAAGYGYPQAAKPTVGSGYMAVLRYRAPDGSEQQLIRRSAPGMPHPEWQILHELRAMNVPPHQVLELHTELQSCELPGAYCARMIRETWPQVRITHTAPYGRDFASRQAGVRHLVEHQDELQQFADGPPRSAPVRVPLPQVQAAPAVGLDVIGQELVQAYGPQGVFRYAQQAVARQGVPDIVAQSLVWSGLPLEIAPFFWAQAQPGRPVPTLAELAMERGVQPAPDAGTYLVMGTDFGRQLCVQYGTAHIVAVPMEAGPGMQPAAPQFVNASLPQFARCMALLGRMWRLRYGLNPEQAGHWTTDFQAQLAALDPQAVADPENWWSVLLEQMWDGLL